MPGWSWFDSVDLTLDSRFFLDASAFVLRYGKRERESAHENTTMIR